MCLLRIHGGSMFCILGLDPDLNVSSLGSSPGSAHSQHEPGCDALNGTFTSYRSCQREHSSFPRPYTRSHTLISQVSWLNTPTWPRWATQVEPALVSRDGSWQLNLLRKWLDKNNRSRLGVSNKVCWRLIKDSDLCSLRKKTEILCFLRNETAEVCVWCRAYWAERWRNNGGVNVAKEISFSYLFKIFWPQFHIFHIPSLSWNQCWLFCMHVSYCHNSEFDIYKSNVNILNINELYISVLQWCC